MLDIGILAQTAPSGLAQGIAGAGGFGSILMMVAIFVVFYFILIFPESKKRKKLQKEISELKIGDKVYTTGGILGLVDFIGDKTVYLKSLDSKFEIAKEFISGVIKK